MVFKLVDYRCKGLGGTILMTIQSYVLNKINRRHPPRVPGRITGFFWQCQRPVNYGKQLQVDLQYLRAFTEHFDQNLKCRWLKGFQDA